MKTRPDYLYLEDILNCMQKIKKYIVNHNFDSFLDEELTQDAVIRNLEIIGEASRHLTEGTRLKAKDIPWNRMIGLRNIVSHKYFGVDLEIVWKIITVDLPATEFAVKNLVTQIKIGQPSKEREKE